MITECQYLQYTINSKKKHQENNPFKKCTKEQNTELSEEEYRQVGNTEMALDVLR